jgi:hypothetical protein
MSERFHYSKPTHRLGEITALADEGVILSTVNLLISSIKHHSRLLFRH